MKNILQSFFLMSVLLVSGCISTISERKEYLFVPVHLAYFEKEESDNYSFDPETMTFDNAPDIGTTAFYKSENMNTYKKATSNELYFLTSKKEEIVRFDPNSEDLLIMKTGFTEGFSRWWFFLGSYDERSYPNKYYKNIYFDINEIEDDYLETSFSILAINIGNTPINTLYIADVMPDFIELNGPMKYAVKDIFLPLNVELEEIQGLKHKVIHKEGLQVIVYHVIPNETGIRPGHCVEIIIPVKLLKSRLTQEKYSVDE